AERAGVSAAAIHKIERSGMVPTITTLLKLADAFERPVAYFVDEEPSRCEPVAVTRARERSPVFSARPGIAVSSVSGSHPDFALAGTVTLIEPGASGGPLPPSQREALVFIL